MKTTPESLSGKRTKKLGKIILKIILILISISVAFTIVGSILHATYFQNKFNDIKPYGQLIPVEDGNMHLYSMGHGETTIVLLPGMGIALPSAQFAPLMRKLSKTYTVVSLEYFGTGFSTETSIPRTCENYVEEIRTALSKAGFEAPYVLMPHSISSLYSEYYAAKYPGEVRAIISLDGTSSAFYQEMPSAIRSLLSVAKFQQATGSSSLISLLTDRKTLISEGFTAQEIDDMIIIAGFALNNTSLEQIANPAEFIKETMQLPYPDSIPYFKIISKQTFETPNPQLKQVGMTPQEYQFKHLERIGKQARYEILDGSHFIYLNNVDKIAEITDSFLQQ